MRSRTVETDLGVPGWLMENSGPVIRYRTATELLTGNKTLDIATLKTELLASPLVEAWLKKVEKPSGKLIPESFETVSAKLWSLGLRAGMAPLDQLTAPYRQWITEHTRPYGESSDDLRANCAQTNCVVGLVRFGYEDNALKLVLKRWLETFYQTASVGHYEPCLAAGFYRDVPLSMRDKPVFKPGRYSTTPDLPHVYAFANMPSDMRNKSIKVKVDVILRYMLDARFSQRHVAVLRPEPDQGILVGWGLELPGLNGFDLDSFATQSLLPRLLLLAAFARVQALPWFKAAVKHLDTFKSGKDKWVLPKTYLVEKTNAGSWENGFLMGLEENRRTPKSLEVESTFYMTLLKSMIE